MLLRGLLVPKEKLKPINIKGPKSLHEIGILIGFTFHLLCCVLIYFYAYYFYSNLIVDNEVYSAASCWYV